ncbi:hypothetical protein, partial [Sunxiuqinia indica]|uniref:hypothetical protein n=1 Tax=Sunxiuqinia indica TaxID=2692584 RepID=UPI001F2E5404
VLIPKSIQKRSSQSCLSRRDLIFVLTQKPGKKVKADDAFEQKLRVSHCPKTELLLSLVKQGFLSECHCCFLSLFSSSKPS